MSRPPTENNKAPIHHGRRAIILEALPHPSASGTASSASATADPGRRAPGDVARDAHNARRVHPEELRPSHRVSTAARVTRGNNSYFCYRRNPRRCAGLSLLESLVAGINTAGTSGLAAATFFIATNNPDESNVSTGKVMATALVAGLSAVAAGLMNRALIGVSEETALQNARSTTPAPTRRNTRPSRVQVDFDAADRSIYRRIQQRRALNIHHTSDERPREEQEPVPPQSPPPHTNRVSASRTSYNHSGRIV